MLHNYTLSWPNNSSANVCNVCETHRGRYFFAGSHCYRVLCRLYYISGDVHVYRRSEDSHWHCPHRRYHPRSFGLGAGGTLSSYRLPSYELKSIHNILRSSNTGVGLIWGTGPRALVVGDHQKRFVRWTSTIKSHSKIPRAFCLQNAFIFESISLCFTFYHTSNFEFIDFIMWVYACVVSLYCSMVVIMQIQRIF